MLSNRLVYKIPRVLFYYEFYLYLHNPISHFSDCLSPQNYDILTSCISYWLSANATEFNQPLDFCFIIVATSGRGFGDIVSAKYETA